MSEMWRSFWRGAGSLVNIWPAPPDHSTGTSTRPHHPEPEPPAAVVDGGPGAGGENLGLAGVLAWIEFLAEQPELVRDEDLTAIRTGLDEYARMPVVSRGLSPDAVAVAGDRYHVRQRLVDRGRARLAIVTAARPVAHVG